VRPATGRHEGSFPAEVEGNLHGTPGKGGHVKGGVLRRGTVNDII